MGIEQIGRLDTCVSMNTTLIIRLDLQSTKGNVQFKSTNVMRLNCFIIRPFSATKWSFDSTMVRTTVGS